MIRAIHHHHQRRLWRQRRILSSSHQVVTPCRSLLFSTNKIITTTDDGDAPRRAYTTLSPLEQQKRHKQRHFLLLHDVAHHHNNRRFSNSSVSQSPNNEPSSSPPRRGLFSIPELQTPTDFAKQASLAIRECDRLRASLQTTAAPKSTEEARLVLYQLDEISRIVCNVIDAAELCRSVHVDAAWRDAASRAFGTLSDYIAQLNADPSLHRALQQVLALAANDDSTSSIRLTREEVRLAQQLRTEFERDGIHLPDQERDQVRRLQNQIVELETLFSRNLVTWQRDFVAHSASDVQAVLPPHVLQAFGIADSSSSSSSSRNEMTLTSDTQLLQTLLKYSTSPSLRKQVYMEYTTAVPDNLVILEALRQRRHELARKCSNTFHTEWNSYAERFVANQMAQTPRNVNAFLQTASRHLQPALRQELELLSRAKQAMEGNGQLEAWDITHYTGLLKSRRRGSGDGGELFDPNEIASYLSLTQCLESMKQLCSRLFGIDLREEKMTNQERWDGMETTTTTTTTSSANDNDAPGQRVRRFVLTDTNEGRNHRPLGTLYLDLHPRPGKYGHAAHFTVRCGCRIRPPEGDIIQDDYYDNSDDYQLPVVALVCNLSSSSGGEGSNNDTLSHGEVETLFHELGHALHSLLSRTSFQHMAGTRGAMDFVETPSHLMENYVWDAQFLRDHLTSSSPATGGRAMPDDLITKLQQSRYDFHAIERQTQILYATLDQRLFGVPTNHPGDASAAANANDSTQIFARLHDEFHLPYATGTHWHSRFGHLVTYGAGYYSYLYAQVLAGDIWKHLFGGGGGGGNGREDADSLNKKAGMELWHKLLIHGGAKDPTTMLKDLLGRPPPSFGDF